MMRMKEVFATSAYPGKSGKKELTEPKTEVGYTYSRRAVVLVAYFSHSGNTRVIGQQIHERIGGDIFEIVPVDPYPRDYDEVVKQAQKELNEDYRPKLETRVENMESYNLVFVGHPNWWGTIPRPVATFLSEYDFSGKTIAPFCTHEGSRQGRSVTDIRKLCPQSTILDGLAVRGSNVKNAQDEVSRWLRKIGMMKQKKLPGPLANN
jgi:flavodoxin